MANYFEFQVRQNLSIPLLPSRKQVHLRYISISKQNESMDRGSFT